MTPPENVLVVVTRRIGDVLLTTPLIRSLKQAWPNAAIDVLVFTGTEDVLAANPDIRRILVIPERPTFGEHLALLWHIARRYGVALSVVPGDRPTLYAWIAGRWRAGLVVDRRKHRWKTWLLHRWEVFDDVNTHTVRMHLSLARILAIPACREVVPAWRDEDRIRLERSLPSAATQPYAVLHAFPKFNYKMWRQAGWIEVARWLRGQGLALVLSGSGDAAERRYVAAIAREVPEAVNLCGKLTLNEAACLIARARAYVGPDTALTHIAAALGVPVVTIYGPTDPVKWGPWPAGFVRDSNPWRRHGSQRVNNVILIQGQATCVPCLKEGCDRRVESYSDCLQQLSPQRVIAAMTDALSLDLPRHRA